MMTSRGLVNLISLSRIPIALLFVVFFVQNETFLYVSLGLCFAAVATDILDGYAARKFGVASIQGRHWDSLGDKAFYIAVIVAFNSNKLLGPIVSWALLLREVALYITRILYLSKLRKIERIRPLTNWHGYFMYLTVVLGFVTLYARTKALDFDLYLYTQISAYMALAFGVGSIIHFLKLS
jgi:phosphatidylglycerophosphate synthase